MAINAIQTRVFYLIYSMQLFGGLLRKLLALTTCTTGCYHLCYIHELCQVIIELL